MKYLNWLAACFTLVIAFSANLLAQPRDVWVRRYTEVVEGQAGYWFNDIYLTMDRNYAMCGKMSFNNNQGSGTWVLVTSSDGEVLLNGSYQAEAGDAYGQGFTIIETDGGGFVFGGVSSYHQQAKFSLANIDVEGNVDWWSYYGAGSGKCTGVIELKAGGYAACGYDREREATAFG